MKPNEEHMRGAAAKAYATMIKAADDMALVSKGVADAIEAVEGSMTLADDERVELITILKQIPGAE